MSKSDEYEAIYRRIIAGIDRTPRLLKQINKLDLSDYDERRKLLLEIGYQPANYDLWKHIVVLSQFEWINLIIGIEPMNPNINSPNPDKFNELIWGVDCWSMMHRLVANKLINARIEIKRSEIQKMIKNTPETFSNDSYCIADFMDATESLSLHIPSGLRESIISTSDEIETDERRWIFRRIANNQWEIGEEGASQRLKGVLGFHDLYFAIQNSGKDIELESMVGAPAGELPNFGSGEMIDRQYILQVENAINDIQQSIDIAKSEKKDDLVRDYEDDKTKLVKILRTGTRPGGKPRKLDEGNPKKKIAIMLRNRQETVQKKLEAASLLAVAKHFKAHYKVTDYSVSYCPLNDSSVHWILGD